MNALKKPPPIKAENLLPSRLADQQLDHLERMIGSIVKNSPAAPVLGLDPEYWESRVRALVEENNLLVVQQQRVQRLLIKLQQRVKKQDDGPDGSLSLLAPPSGACNHAFDQLPIFSSSTSNVSVLFGGMAPTPRSP